MSLPVIGTGGGGSHCGVHVILNEPIEALFCKETHFLPVLLRKVAAVSVEVPEKHHILLTPTQTQQLMPSSSTTLSNRVILEEVPQTSTSSSHVATRHTAHQAPLWCWLEWCAEV